MKENTEELVRRMKAGDKEAFDALYSLYAGKLYGMAFLISGSRTDSEDILQEVFVTCYLKKESLREAAAFERWIYQIMVRTAWRYMKQNRQKQTSSLDALLEVSDGIFGGFTEHGKETSEPLDCVVRKEERKQLLRAVQDLDVKQRTVIVLYYFNECSIKEIARITGTLEGTVKSRLFKGRKNLRISLEREEME